MFVTSRLSRGFLTVIVLTGAGAGGVASAEAATKSVISAPVRVTSVPSLKISGYPGSIQTNAQGDELATWTESAGWYNAAAPLTVGFHQFFSYKMAGGTWAPKVETESPSASIDGPGAALTGDGTVTIVSQVALAGGFRGLKVRTGDVREPIAKWKTQQFEIPGKSITRSSVLASSAGTTALTLFAVTPAADNDYPNATMYTTQRFGAESFAAPSVLIPTMGGYHDYVSSLNSAGDLAVAWSEFSDFQHDFVRVVTRPAGGSLSPARTLTPGTFHAQPGAVVATPGGGAVVSWEQGVAWNLPGGRTTQQAHARRVNANGTIGPDQTLSGISSLQNIRPQLFTDDAGRVTAAWNFTYGTENDLASAYGQAEMADAPPGGSFGPKTTVPLADGTTLGAFGSIAKTPSGGLFAIGMARAAGASADTYHAFYRPPGAAAFDAPLDLRLGLSFTDSTIAAVSGPGRYSLMSKVLEPARRDGETMILMRRTALVDSASTDTALPKVSVGPVAQSATSADGKSTLSAGYTLSESASVTAVLSTKQRGVYIDGGCAALPAGGAATAAVPCLRRVTVSSTPVVWSPKHSGTLTFAAPKAGTYTLTIAAKDRAGNNGTAPTSVTVE